MREIVEELEKAHTAGDLASKESLIEEREGIREQLRGAEGSGGRIREASSDPERARQSVSAAIHRALKAIKREHKPLWKHLDKSLKIGNFLSYRPDQPTAWET